ncbi:MAG: 4,5-dihydroxyphthalate decarboxylase [Homoserinimonas sp.]|jgi:4,5-dihydroxyphthalate decarboxylase|nr:4,5-dihydroxyphthalate decarboxylase [Homoserinimonas sp.]
MSLLPLTLAAVHTDRFRALLLGDVRPEGIDLNFLSLPVEEIFYRQVEHEEFDVSELSLSSYVLTLDREEPPFVAIPVFPSRYFRHQSIFINERSGIRSPEDLIGKRVGVPEYQITASVWQRGLLHEDFGVAPQDVEYFTGGVDSVGRHEKITLGLPDDIKVQPIGPDDTLSRMLSEGRLDAVMSANVPSCFYTDSHVRRLFPDYKSVEKEYFARTRIFPIMHVVAIKRGVLEAHPWVARSLMKAFDESLRIAKEELMYRSSLKTMLPWLADHIEETVATMGDDFWTYGVESNRHVLDTFLKYSHQQGLAKKLRTADELFAPGSDSSFVV